jgi:long-subunit acyl-CoA synthetase (AMP-forming)
MAMMNDVLFMNCDTPQKVFLARCKEWANAPALRHKRRGLWQTTRWADYFDNACAVGLALTEMGLQRGDTVCVLAENRPEWLYADMGAQCMGLVGNGIYPTASPDQVAFILQHSRAHVLFVENQEQLEKALGVRSTCPDLQRIVVMEREGLRALNDERVVFFDDLMARGKMLAVTQTALFEQSIKQTMPGDVAFLVYTSGTTGQPKGAMHRAIWRLRWVTGLCRFCRCATLRSVWLQALTRWPWAWWCTFRRTLARCSMTCVKSHRMCCLHHPGFGKKCIRRLTCSCAMPWRLRGGCTTMR